MNYFTNGLVGSPEKYFQGNIIFSSKLIQYINTSDEINDDSTELEVQQRFRLYYFGYAGEPYFLTSLDVNIVQTF